ncbi:MAG: 1-deoxy-D-xylulose-5-phosphate synthase, partial [Candidatus Omnitrophica bacterium]|nr:1-deoxy-D-xylulose-5-phosphate synthase [Candidatus Omnitrophota bacterium]
TGPFYIETGEALESKEEKARSEASPAERSGASPEGAAEPSCTEAFSDAMVELGRKDKNVVAITAAMPEGTGLAKFGEQFPERFFNVGMAEQHAVAFAAGLAKGGFKPVCAIYSTFLQRSYDQIVHDVALQNLNVIFAVDRGGVVGEDGPTHHGVFDIAYLRHIPNLVLMAPKDTDELKAMLEFAVNYNGPIAIRYPRGKLAPISLSEMKGFGTVPLIIGKSEVLREGANADVAILALGSMVAPSLKAADLLKKDGIEASVINARYAAPIDKAFIKSLASKGMSIVTIEEGITDGGFGSRVLEFIQESGFENIKLKRLGFPDKFIEHAKRDELLKDYGLNAEGIAYSIKELIGNRVKS